MSTRFHYQGRNFQGKHVHGIREATSAEAIASMLQSEGITPISIEQLVETSEPLEKLKAKFVYRRVKLSDLLMFCRQMYTLTKAHVPIISAVSRLAKSYKNQTMVAGLKSIVDSLESGLELAAAMQRHPDIFSPLIVNMIKIGENTGRLDDAFLKVSEYLELEQSTTKRLTTAVRYPIFVVSAIAIAIVIINMFVIPGFSNAFAGMNMELPYATKLILAVSDFFTTYWYAIGGALLATVLGLYFYCGTENGRYYWDKYMLKVPAVGNIFERIMLARFGRTLAMVQKSGMPLSTGIRLAAEALGNAYGKYKIDTMRGNIERGESLTRAAESSGIFTPLVVQMLAVGEDTGQIETTMDDIAEFYEREVDYDLKRMGDIIEPILLTAVGVMVLILALGVFLPMWEMASLS